MSSANRIIGRTYTSIALKCMGFCRWLFYDTNRYSIDGIVMLGGICQDGRTQATKYVGNLQRSHLFTNYCTFLFVGMSSTTHTNMTTPCDMHPGIANTVYIVIAFDSYEMYRLIHRKLKIKQHNPTKTWGQRQCSGKKRV